MWRCHYQNQNMPFLIKYLFGSRLWLDCKYGFAKVFQVLWEIIVFYRIRKECGELVYFGVTSVTQHSTCTRSSGETERRAGSDCSLKSQPRTDSALLNNKKENGFIFQGTPPLSLPLRIKVLRGRHC